MYFSINLFLLRILSKIELIKLLNKLSIYYFYAIFLPQIWNSYIVEVVKITKLILYLLYLYKRKKKKPNTKMTLIIKK